MADRMALLLVCSHPSRGGATGGCTFAIWQGIQRNLRRTPAGYYRLVATAGCKSYAIRIRL